MKILFLGGPWHDQEHEIPDGVSHWEVPVTVTAYENWRWYDVVDQFQYRLRGDVMVPALAPPDEVAELLAQRP